jgi:heat shock protein HslJ
MTAVLTRLACLLAALGLPACRADETVAGHGAAGKTWTLTELDGQPFAARATLTFPEPGRIAGQAPCNRYFAALEVPYPWFDATEIGATRMACPDLPAETAFLAALGEMTLSEVLGDVLILSNETGRTLLFRASD